MTWLPQKGEVREYTFYFTAWGDTAADIDLVSVWECICELHPVSVVVGREKLGEGHL
ncbi:MAG: hypothetical protein IPN76_04170 [Saprospiraceae bacterium]|nr:hypothetical protein [Saprospiraceae bacterium]